jgi:hypothetical protein
MAARPPFDFAWRGRLAASRLGISFETYLRHVAADEWWCGTCRAWLPPKRFSSRRGGRPAGACTACKVALQRIRRQRRA